jgi:acetyl esterase/lipase
MEPKFVLDFMRSLGSSVASRRRRGAAHPSWGLVYETVVTTMRETRQRLEPLPIQDQRRIWDRIAPPSPALGRVRVTEVTLGGVPSFRCTPRSRAEPATTLLYFHGGAYGFGSWATHRSLVARLALVSGAEIVFPSYRLAPEHPFPAAVDDAARVYAELVQGAGRVVVGGDSAGGGLAAALCVRARDEGLPSPLGSVLLSPFVDQVDLTAHPDRARLDWLTPEWGKGFTEAYLQGAEPAHPYASPGRADLSSLPPTLVQVGDAEILYEQCARFVERGRAAGADVILDVDRGMTHSYQMLADLIPEAGHAVERLGRFIRRVAARRSSG